MKVGVGYAFVLREASERERLENAKNRLRAEYRALAFGLKKSEADIFLWHTAVLNDAFTDKKMIEKITGGRKKPRACSAAEGQRSCFKKPQPGRGLQNTPGQR